MREASRRSALFALCAIAVTGGSARSQTAGGANLSRADLKRLIAEDKVVLVDVREPDEFKGGRIPGAKLLPMSSFDPAKLPSAAGKQTVIYCRSGRRAQQALAIARAAGRTDLAVYPGSMLDWEGAGEPIEK